MLGDDESKTLSSYTSNTIVPGLDDESERGVGRTKVMNKKPFTNIIVSTHPQLMFAVSTVVVCALFWNAALFMCA